MAAYLVVEHTITDLGKFEEYRVKVGPLIAKHGGRYITKAGSHKLLEVNRRPPDRVVIIEFPDIAALSAWYNSPEYQPLHRATEHFTGGSKKPDQAPGRSLITWARLPASGCTSLSIPRGSSPWA